MRLRPVGSTSRRPRVGAPDGPGATRRPSSAASSASRSWCAHAAMAASIALDIGWSGRRGRWLSPMRCATPPTARVEHVQVVANGEILDVAKLRVELGDRIARSIGLLKSAVLGKARAPGPVEDLALEDGDAAAVDAVCLGILLDRGLRAHPADLQGPLRRAAASVPDGDGARCAAWPAPPRRGC